MAPRTLHILYMIKIGHSKFKKGAADWERGEKLNKLKIIPLKFLSKVDPCYSELVWGSNHTFNKLYIISQHYTTVLGNITTRNNQTFLLRVAYIPVAMEV